MINDIKDYFRYRIYTNSNILVNDLKETFEDIRLFLDKQVQPYLEENKGRIVVSNIELSFNEKLIWRIVEPGELNTVETKEFNNDNIKEIITDDYINEFKQNHVLYPKELCGKSLVSFMETIHYFIYYPELIDEINVMDICKLSNNGTNNIVHEL